MSLIVWLICVIGYVVFGCGVYVVRLPRSYRENMAWHQSKQHRGCKCLEYSTSRRIVQERIVKHEAIRNTVWAALLWPCYLALRITIASLNRLWTITVLQVHRVAWRPIERDALRERADQALRDED